MLIIVSNNSFIKLNHQKIQLKNELYKKMKYAMKKCHPKFTLTRECNQIWTDVDNIIDKLNIIDEQMSKIDEFSDD